MTRFNINSWPGETVKISQNADLWEVLEAYATQDNATLYALVDAARSDQVLPRLASGQSDYQSLFVGTEKEPLFSAGPFLVSPGGDRALLKWLATEAWGESMVLFITSQAPCDQLLHHLQSLLKAITEENDERFFRYYDPRVLRNYLPNCDSDSGWRFMGPVARLMVEAEEGGRLLCWKRESLGCVPACDDSIWRQPLYIDADQLRIFRQGAFTEYKAGLKAHLKVRFAKQIETLRLDDGDLSQLVTNGIDRARMYGIRTRFDVRRFVEYMLLLDPDFDLNPDYQWAGKIIFTNGLAGREKMDLLDRAVVLQTLQAQRNRFDEEIDA